MICNFSPQKPPTQPSGGREWGGMKNDALKILLKTLIQRLEEVRLSEILVLIKQKGKYETNVANNYQKILYSANI